MSESLNTHRRRLLQMVGGATTFAATPALAARPAGEARYRVTLLSRSPLRFAVQADLPGSGERLTMGESYPAELPEMARQGWPALVIDLAAFDTAGPLPLTPGRNHWKLNRPAAGRVTLDYTVDFGVFERASWSSPRESVVTEEATIAVSGRGIFIAGGEAPAEVTFVLPRPWRAMVPWERRGLGGETYRVDSLTRLQDNMLGFSREAPMRVSSGGFTLQVAAMGSWRPLAGPIRDALQRIVRREVELMGWRGHDVFNVLLVPTTETGGEAYRQSLVVTFDGPTIDNRPQWANFLAHEIFHYWNASRLRGADYPSSQWFQEGFTEYAANLTLLSTGVATPDWFLGKLATHIANAARLETTMEKIGTRKGAPLYSSGALVAFSWDVAIRSASGGKRDFGHFFRNLWRMTDNAKRPYAWPDIRLALEATAAGDWEGFHARHIAGREPLPLDETLAKAGLKRVDAEVQINDAASPDAEAVWRSLLSS